MDRIGSYSSLVTFLLPLPLVLLTPLFCFTREHVHYTLPPKCHSLKFRFDSIPSSSLSLSPFPFLFFPRLRAVAFASPTLSFFFPFSFFFGVQQETTLGTSKGPSSCNRNLYLHLHTHTSYIVNLQQNIAYPRHEEDAGCDAGARSSKKCL